MSEGKKQVGEEKEGGWRRKGRRMEEERREDGRGKVGGWRREGGRRGGRKMEGEKRKQEEKSEELERWLEIIVLVAFPETGLGSITTHRGLRTGFVSSSRIPILTLHTCRTHIEAGKTLIHIKYIFLLKKERKEEGKKV